MLKFKFDKLVRDKIVEKQIASGAKSHYRKLSPPEHKKELVKKIIEEVKEITYSAEEELAGEIADVQQAIDDLTEKYGLTREDVSKAQQLKSNDNGAFKAGYFVDYVEVTEDNPWVDYYRKNSDRYPEVS